ncbi:hypothetical protein BWZ20_08250 [Winogradskyella sp. J14-2]|uniref:DUF1800 domain-containing protein n=1 Tax=Winogradskyella sp. J14-2 TaxID=1936080 RepID=UPI00097280D2|nr:DUF1800 domain-containing protein [Winogradskyella sp. J14-2]APY08290.1 hypothetical protein BWZ20_08250 [Winogradskyella sp. J14-2]
MKQEELQHLYHRAGFGWHPRNYKEISKDRKQVVDALFENSKSILPIQLDFSYLDGLNQDDLKKFPSVVKDIQKKNKKKILELNYEWLKKLIYSNTLLRERMTLFWANHFVCRERNPLFAQQYNNTLRHYAIGDFRVFVKAISKNAAMLRYLNGKQNRKRKPNENFARELMELFTLGEGHFTEKDIKESARAFTGYSHNFEGGFVFRKLHHDYGFKTFLGKTARFNGDDIIDEILSNKQCARFICQKIYRYFVNPKLNKTHIEAMTDVFFKDYNIENLMRFVLLSDWFYAEENIGSKIKSPVELLVGIANTVPVTFQRQRDLLVIQKLLGQMLLDPPNVAGWKGDKAWIDANTIMLRLKLPSVLLNNAVISLEEFGDFNDATRAGFLKNNKGKLPFKTLADWDTFLKEFNSVETENLHQVILQGSINKGTLAYLETLRKTSKRDYCIQLMSLPEYQMC